MHKILSKYHKQSLSKDVLKRLDQINKSLNLNLSLNNDLDILTLRVFETGLQNKKNFERAFEKVRNDQFDMWDYLDFNERKHILSIELATLKETTISFKSGGINIYMPFFSPLLNQLYGEETAILELPQFFKLYTDYKKDIESIFNYKLEPFVSFIEGVKCLYYDEKQICLYDPSLQSFYLIDDSYHLKKYPLWMKKSVSEEDIQQLSQFFISHNELDAFRYLESRDLLRKKLIRKLKKKFKKEGIQR